MQDVLLSVLSGLLPLIPQLFILVSCIIFVSGKNTPEGIMLTIGSSIGVLTTIFHSMIIPYLLRTGGISSISNHTQMYTVSGIIGLLAAILFAVGFFMLVQNYLKKTTD